MEEHLDGMDRRRRREYADARCRDCDYYLSGYCEAEEYVAAEVHALLAEADKDAAFPALRIVPEEEMPASRCPGFRPSSNYVEELQRLAEDARETVWDDFCAAHGCGSRGDPRRIFASGLRPPA